MRSGTRLEKLVGEAKQMGVLECQHDLLVDRINQLSVENRRLSDYGASLSREAKLDPMHAAMLREHQ